MLYNLRSNQIERLQRIQNQEARMLKRIPRRNHIHYAAPTLWNALDLDILILIIFILFL